MKLCFMLLANLKCSLSDYKAGAAIPYTLIRWTRNAAESSNFQIMTYHASLWQQDLLFTVFFSWSRAVHLPSEQPRAVGVH